MAFYAKRNGVLKIQRSYLNILMLIRLIKYFFAFNDRYYFITKLETIMQLCAKVNFSPKRKAKIRDNV